ncbi:MAG: zinc-dependent alcohol dehydrogenase [Bacillota bacterium]
MKAAVLEDVRKLKMCEKEEPSAGIGEAVIKIKYAGICGSDITIYKGEHPTATMPVVLGHEIYGTVCEINDTYSGFKAGERVVVNPLISCGSCDACIRGHFHVCRNLKLLGIHEDGGFEEYVRVKADKLVKVPETLNDLEAALVEPFAVGYHVNYRSGVRIGDTVLVIGAGTIGLVVGLIARKAGARVIITEINKQRLELAGKFGLETIDSEKTDALKELLDRTNGSGADVVYEASGSRAGILLMTNACKIRGTMVPLSLSAKAVEFELGKVSFKEMSVVGSRVYEHYHFLRAVDTIEKIAKEYDITQLCTQICPSDEVVSGVEDMLNGRNIGKILVQFN